MKIRVKIKENWVKPFNLEYDGKYISLLGGDKNYPDWFTKYQHGIEEYDETVLVPVVEEIRNASPEIIKIDNEYIYIETNT